MFIIDIYVRYIIYIFNTINKNNMKLKIKYMVKKKYLKSEY